jgi:hypothetical protein
MYQFSIQPNQFHHPDDDNIMFLWNARTFNQYTVQKPEEHYYLTKNAA